jgi:hypothetical protein
LPSRPSTLSRRRWWWVRTQATSPNTLTERERERERLFKDPTAKGKGTRARTHTHAHTHTQERTIVMIDGYEVELRCYRIRSKYGDKIGSCFPDLKAEHNQSHS